MTSLEKYLQPTGNEKKKHAEFPTPVWLCREMVNILPKSFWKDVKKVFEPSSGKGVFLLVLIEKFMEGLEDKYPDKNKRYKVIVEECIYWSELTKLNTFICSRLLDPENKGYNLNYNQGDTLHLDIKKKFKLDHFDLVVGNPPFDKGIGKGKGHTLWDKFVKISLDYWLRPDGYLLFVHPSGWRQVNGTGREDLINKQMVYLEIHDVKDGVKTFHASTRYDWYLTQNKPYIDKTTVKDQEGKIVEVDLRKYPFIPNFMFKDIYKMINGKEKIQILHSESAYEGRKLWMNKTKTSEFKYPCVYTINSNNEPTFYYSSVNDKGHFGISKIILSNGKGILLDNDGKYGMTQWAFGIVNTKTNLPKILKFMKTEKFQKIVSAINLDSKTYNFKALRYFNELIELN